MQTAWTSGGAGSVADVGRGLKRVTPLQMVAGIVLLHVVVWTLVPAVAHRGVPLDVVEGYAVGREWVIGYHKHPALPWWLLEMSRVLSGGAVGWPAYLLSAMCVAVAYWLAFLLGRDLLGTARAAAGAILLTGVVYFSWVIPEFNHNVVQMPIWLGALWALARARARRHVGWWMLLGALGALGLYAKLTMALVLIVMAAFIVVDRQCREQLRTAGPWAGLGAFAIVATPLVQWLVVSGFQPIEYAESRAGNRAGGITIFFLKQLAASAGLYLLLVAVFGRRLLAAMMPARLAEAWRHDPDTLRFLTWMHFGPIVLAMSIASVSGSGMKGAWGTPMLCLTGLLVMAWAPTLLDAPALRRIGGGAAALVLATGLAYGIHARMLEPEGQSPARIDWPQVEMAQRIERAWIERTGKPLKIVAGDFWTAGIVSLYASSRPRLLVDAEPSRAPWLKLEDMERDGVMFIWWSSSHHPPLHMRPLAGSQVTGAEQFWVPAAKGKQTGVSISFVIRPPGSRFTPASNGP